MSDLIKIGIVAAVVGAAFLLLWQQGYLVKIRNYVDLTMDELRKCSWPNWEELKGSTVVVSISLVLLGVFTWVVDIVCYKLLQLIT